MTKLFPSLAILQTIVGFMCDFVGLPRKLRRYEIRPSFSTAWFAVLEGGSLEKTQEVWNKT